MNKTINLEDKLKETYSDKLIIGNDKSYTFFVGDTKSLVDRSINYKEDTQRINTLIKCEVSGYAGLYEISRTDAISNINYFREIRGYDPMKLPGLDDNYLVDGGQE